MVKILQEWQLTRSWFLNWMFMYLDMEIKKIIWYLNGDIHNSYYFLKVEFVLELLVTFFTSNLSFYLSKPLPNYTTLFWTCSAKHSATRQFYHSWKKFVLSSDSLRNPDGWLSKHGTNRQTWTHMNSKVNRGANQKLFSRREVQNRWRVKCTKNQKRKLPDVH